MAISHLLTGLARLRYSLACLIVVAGQLHAEPVVFAQFLRPMQSKPSESSPLALATFGMGYNAGRLFDNKQIQVFTAEASGILDLALFTLETRKSVAPPPRVRIVTFEEARIQETLATSFVEFSSIGSTGGFSRTFNVMADFRGQSLFLESGKQYAIVFDTSEPDANYGLQVFGGVGYSHRGRWSSEYSGAFTPDSGSVVLRLIGGHHNDTGQLSLSVISYRPPESSSYGMPEIFQRLAWSAKIGATYRLRSSTNLSHWSTVATLTCKTPFGMIDRSTLVLQPGYPLSEFFRIEEVPSP